MKTTITNSRPVLFGLWFFCMLVTAYSTASAQQIKGEGTAAEDQLKSSAQSILLQTDTNIDVTFYHIDIELDIAGTAIIGKVNVSFNSLTEGLASIRLNLKNFFTVTAIDGASSWTHTSDILTIVLEEPLALGSASSVEIEYNGQPELISSGGVNKGLRFQTRADGAPAIVNLSTPYFSHYWYPCKDGPSDKADSVYVNITVPETYNGFALTAVSNGKLEGTTTESGMKTFNWRHRYPIAPYYVLVAVSNYTVINRVYSNNGTQFPLTYYAYPQDVPAANTLVSNIPEMLDFFIDLYGDYPFAEEGYGLTQIPVLWAIESQTNNVIGTWSEAWLGFIAHELSHAWFGNSITNKTWQHVWLQEGFATYSEALYIEAKQGKEAFLTFIRSFNERFNASQRLFLEDDAQHNKVFSQYVFDKGAWVVHMLRNHIGDELFFQCLKTYAQSPAFQYGHATTEDFRLHCEQITNMNLSAFFEQWVYDRSYPDYKYNFYSDVETGKAGLAIKQTQGIVYQERAVFEMYMDILLTFDDGSERLERVFNNKQLQYFYFDIDKEVTQIVLDPDEWIIRRFRTLDTNITVPLFQSFENHITSFTISGQIGESVINNAEGTVTVSMPFGTNLTQLAPVILVSANAMVSPPSTQIQDFSLPVSYVVTGGNGLTRNYLIIVTTVPNNDNRIVSFSISGETQPAVINVEEKTVVAIVPVGMSLEAIIPDIVISENAEISPDPSVPIDYSNDVQFTITSESGIAAEWVVRVLYEVSSGTGGELNLSNPLFYPNPTRDKLFWLVNPDYITVDVISVDGRVVRSAAGANGYLSMSGLHTGMYVIRIETARGTYLYSKVVLVK
ncbi:M1 family aminopeptidase [Alkaliflexus imshenetskii]|uniref:M1 family aminopeptidase n=1 Tax=Alkaliflexus imshenetskii TaxID=286730 RepID=UPI000A014DCE|nr:M1 family aminopeptidase [Alkaliflexus imshenetskii]